MYKLPSIFKSEFTKNTLILVIGTVFAQLIPLLMHPYLRRMYSPEDFGALAVYLNIFSILTIVSSLRYEAGIVLPKNDNEAANILSLSFVINIIFSFIILLAIIFFKNQIVHLINFPEKYANFLYFLPFASSVFGIYQSMNYWLIRRKAFKASTNNKIIRRTIEAGTQAILAIFKVPGGLFIGDFAGNLANVFAGFRQIFKNAFKTVFVSPRKMKFVFMKYIEFPKFNMLPTLLSSAATILPFLFINKIYSTDTVGFLDLSRLVLSIPLIFVSATISQVFFQHASEKKHETLSLKKEVKGILLILLSVIFLEILVIQSIGPQIFGFVFGEKYIVSGEFSKILIFSFALNFIGSTFSSVFILFGKIKINSIWQICYFLSICSLLFFKSLAILDFLKIYVLIEVLMHLSYLSMVYVIIRNYELGITKNIIN